MDLKINIAKKEKFYARKYSKITLIKNLFALPMKLSVILDQGQKKINFKHPNYIIIFSEHLNCLLIMKTI